jgi:hypothetical protein
MIMLKYIYFYDLISILVKECHLLPEVFLVPLPSGRGERVYILAPTYPTPMTPGVVVFFVS